MGYIFNQLKELQNPYKRTMSFNGTQIFLLKINLIPEFIEYKILASK